MLWLDRRSSLPPAQAATHALVVGVSRYDHLPPRASGPSPDPLKFGLVQVTTPAAGAYRFARWLHTTYHNPTAPLATIRLLLSPSDQERQADPELDSECRRVPAADREQVRAAVLEWQADNLGNRGGTTICYVSGHGALMSYIDSYVLLQDFAKDQRVLDYALDVGSVYRGMNHPDLPLTQFYFIDACRVRPQAFAKYRHLGAGVGLAETWAGADRRAAPIFFSASVDTPAYGDTGAGGTLFSAVLMDCLGGVGVDGQATENGTFTITNASLQRALEERLDERIRRLGLRQEVIGGGHARTCVLHTFRQPPEFDYAIRLIPDQALAAAHADVWDCDRRQRVAREVPFAANPLRICLPMGLHSLDVIVAGDGAPFHSRIGLPLLVQAKQVPMPRVVSLDDTAR